MAIEARAKMLKRMMLACLKSSDVIWTRKLRRRSLTLSSGELSTRIRTCGFGEWLTTT